ncbi:MAG: 40S ribosomal protein S21 [Romboutsia sp.]|nr:40S ribosomal protein S21 [Romboutsia sp.]
MLFERRMCTFTERPIDGKDRSSVQIILANLNEQGRADGTTTIVNICGSIRKSGEADERLLEYFRERQ